MSNNPFQKATKKKSYLRFALFGPSGGGKTYSALKIASALFPGGKIAVIDTEHGSASKYADLFSFDVVELKRFSPNDYISMMNAAQANGYDVIIIDSLTHAWSGVGGVLEIVDKAAAASRSGNSFDAWRKGTPEHNNLIEAMLSTKTHLIVTMRSKQDYVVETVEENGRMKSKPRKIGLAPVQRDGLEYEFDVVGEMDIDNTLIISKSRCPILSEGVFKKPGNEIADILRTWLNTGEDVPTTTPAPAPVTVTPAEVEKTMLDAGAHQRGPTEPHVTLNEAVTNYQQMYGDSTDAETIVEPTPTPVDEWWLDDARWGKLAGKATELWQGIDSKHAHNRIARALGLVSWDKRKEFTGCSAVDAWAKIKTYVPSDRQRDDEQQDSDDMAADGTTAADTGEEWTPETNPLLVPETPAEPATVQPLIADATPEPSLDGPCKVCGKTTIKKNLFGEWKCDECAANTTQDAVESVKKMRKSRDPLKPAAGQ